MCHIILSPLVPCFSIFRDVRQIRHKLRCLISKDNMEAKTGLASSRWRLDRLFIRARNDIPEKLNRDFHTGLNGHSFGH
jgi:hypothetical protein